MDLAVDLLDVDWLCLRLLDDRDELTTVAFTEAYSPDLTQLAVLACPLRAGGDVVGSVVAAHRPDRPWTPAEVRAAYAVARVIEVTLGFAGSVDEAPVEPASR
jgi:hypothetical protein